jgi:hypothetical protein
LGVTLARFLSAEEVIAARLGGIVTKSVVHKAESDRKDKIIRVCKRSVRLQ